MNRINHVKSNRKVLANLQVREGEYWKGELKDINEVASFPTDFIMEKGELTNLSYNYTLPNDRSSELKNISKDNYHTLNILLVSTVLVLIYKYTGSKDIIVRLPILKEHQENAVNDEFLLRNKINHQMTFKELLVQVRQTVLDALEHQMFPLDVLYEELNLINAVKGSIHHGVLIQLDNIHVNSNIGNNNFSFSFNLDSDGINLKVNYNSNLYKETTVTRILSHYNKILDQVMNNLNIKLHEIDILTLQDIEWIEHYNSNELSLKQDNIMSIFEEMVAKNPDKKAIVYGDQTLTYRELLKKVNSLARTLREKGINRDHKVAIIAERSIEMIIGIFSVLKAGGAYIPINPNYPKTRVNYFLEDSQANLVLLQSKYKDRLSNDKYNTLLLDDKSNYSTDESSLSNINTKNDLAYIIYTSGSTGKPKGVMVEHRNLIHILNVLQEKYPIEDSDCYLFKTPYTFDVSISELFGWILGRGHLVILEPDLEKDPDRLVKVLDDSNITHVNFVPALLNTFTQQLEENNNKGFKSLKYLMVAGEEFPKKVAQRLRGILKEVCLENLYGPTECTVYATNYTVTGDRIYSSIPIGTPLPNVQVYVVDEHLNHQPIGVKGELCIAGRGVTRGYLNREELNKQHFVHCPWQPEMKMYRTGDLVILREDGQIEYLGRKDNQVKIRGYRIELGEIERTLLEHYSVQEALSITRESKSRDKSIVTYVVLRSNDSLEPKDLINYLQGKLPEYMVPSACIILDSFPLNQNGKINRDALPLPTIVNYSKTDYVAPRDEIEQIITQVWCDVLEVEQIGINEDFFNIGGHSLLATMVIHRLRTILDLNLSMQILYEQRSIAKLADSIRKSKDLTHVKPKQKIPKISRTEYRMN
ncbi:non-ribosomal peptide synthetase [Halalkalibacter hemicellulosilyticus]|uniref:Long-chain-fatty-acid-CoA ligase n=1 Tax=Halalkalibacter hemicellulosilyticusJCM 9152 TaxID=1236971 RepID=W4QKH5_9BACI|nr:non-ribosomal peptide synthetase [Halalkalibacter hemicellulosilyticus]GAE32620.1 long-chain-fatty-acid-CoA ligase [Halalkalibacter hemicellulosilyticusJCM 9152]